MPSVHYERRQQLAAWPNRVCPSDTVVCTKHLLRLELETTTCPRHQRGEQQRLRGLERRVAGTDDGAICLAASRQVTAPRSLRRGRVRARRYAAPTTRVRSRAAVSAAHSHPITMATATIRKSPPTSGTRRVSAKPPSAPRNRSRPRTPRARRRPRWSRSSPTRGITATRR